MNLSLITKIYALKRYIFIILLYVAKYYNKSYYTIKPLSIRWLLENSVNNVWIMRA
jgi:hypothetical protein